MPTDLDPRALPTQGADVPFPDRVFDCRAWGRDMVERYRGDADPMVHCRARDGVPVHTLQVGQYSWYVVRGIAFLAERII